MSYSKCFLCCEDNFSGNETRIVVERKTVDKEKLTYRTMVWEGTVCDDCLREHFAVLAEEVEEGE